MTPIPRIALTLHPPDFPETLCRAVPPTEIRPGPTTPLTVGPQFDVLRAVLSQLFGDLDAATFEIIRPHLAWVELAGGEQLFREGDPSDALFVLISGRLQAKIHGPQGQEQIIGEIGRGESVGEMGVFSGKPRGATVSGLRDSLLARIELGAVQTILAAVPALALNLNRLIIERLGRRNASLKQVRNVTNIAVVGIGERSAVPTLLQPLTAELARQQHAVAHVTSRSIDAAAGRPGAAQATDRDPAAHHWLLAHLDALESRHALVFYETDPTPTPWTRRCLRQADEVLLVADAAGSSELSEVESACLSAPGTRTRQELVLLHPAHADWADGTLGFLARRPGVQRHYHVRAGNGGDLARLARFLSGHAVGLVLAGGGARGLAHIGVFRALEEAGMPVDVIGGTSIGSVLGCCLARGWGWQRIFDANRPAFLSNPTSDLNFFPLVSLLAGRKLHGILARAFGDRHIEELWLPFFCVSSNFTAACEVVHRQGELKRALLASMAIPGVFPPSVHDNDLLVDGGVFNNLPVDVMARTGVRTILAVDLRSDNKARRPLDFTDLPGPWALWLDRLRPKAKRRYQVPSLLTILMATNTLNSAQKTRELLQDVDIHFHPDVRRFGLLEWKSFDLLVADGYRHAQEKLQNPHGSPRRP